MEGVEDKLTIKSYRLQVTSCRFKFNFYLTILLKLNSYLIRGLVASLYIYKPRIAHSHKAIGTTCSRLFAPQLIHQLNRIC